MLRLHAARKKRQAKLCRIGVAKGLSLVAVRDLSKQLVTAGRDDTAQVQMFLCTRPAFARQRDLGHSRQGLAETLFQTHQVLELQPLAPVDQQQLGATRLEQRFLVFEGNPLLAWRAVSAHPLFALALADELRVLL